MENVKSYSIVINFLFIRKTIKLYGTVTAQSWHQLSRLGCTHREKISGFLHVGEGIYKLLWNAFLIITQSKIQQAGLFYVQLQISKLCSLFLMCRE